MINIWFTISSLFVRYVADAPNHCVTYTMIHQDSIRQF